MCTISLHVIIFEWFNFHRQVTRKPLKYFNSENFPIYMYSIIMWMWLNKLNTPLIMTCVLRIYYYTDDIISMFESDSSSSDNFYPFPSKSHALLYLLMNSPRPIVCLNVQYHCPHYFYMYYICRVKQISNLCGMC